MSNFDEAESEDAAIAAMQHLAQDRQPVVLQMSKIATFQLVGALQLVLRHPGIQAMEIARNMEAMARTLENALGTDPVLRQIMQMGWNPSWDQRANPNPPPLPKKEVTS